jgi:rubrerythrin
MDFHEWWVSEIGHPPANKEEAQAFRLCLTAWRVALTRGDREVYPEDTERALKRVGQGESTYEDELAIRLRIQIGDETIAALIADLDTFADVRQAQSAAAEQRREIMPDGAKPLGGTRWRCPRCNFIGGLRQPETICRGCSFPGEDTRAWVGDGDERGALAPVPDEPDEDPVN